MKEAKGALRVQASGNQGYIVDTAFAMAGMYFGKDACRERTNDCNIYKCIHKYLSREEMFDVFVVSVWNGKGMGRPGRTDISFFGREYFQWLAETFGEAAEDRLKAEFPELHAAREEYEEHQKKDYLEHMHRMICEIKDMVIFQ